MMGVDPQLRIFTSMPYLVLNHVLHFKVLLNSFLVQGTYDLLLSQVILNFISLCSITERNRKTVEDL